jgi:hypothetical protein
MERTDPTILGNDVPLGRAEGPADTMVIRAEIRETRERMGETIEEIGERLNPHRLKEQVKHNVREATIGRVENMARNTVDRVSDTTRTFTNVVRENPIPAAMIGIGLGWLLFNRSQERTSERDTRFVARARPRRGLSDVSLGGYDDGGIGESVKDAAEDLADGARRVAGTVADQTRVQTRRVEDQFYENPLAIATATLALGLATGLAVPATSAEVELVGEARDKFVDRMRDVARETTEKVTQAAERVMDDTGATAGGQTQRL